MDEPAELARDGRWRLAVWSLRFGFGVLAVGLVGLVVILTGGTPWILAAGVIAWLVAAAVTLTGFFLARHDLAEPRPGFWPMRWMLIRDTFRARGHV
jgi:hypothetical protein